jgi:hypothetical protein
MWSIAIESRSWVFYITLYFRKLKIRFPCIRELDYCTKKSAIGKPRDLCSNGILPQAIESEALE